MNDKRVAIFAGSFDPFTNGHLEIVREGLKLFDQVVVAIGIHPQKTYLLDAKLRQKMIQETLEGLSVEVVVFDGLVVNLAKKLGALTLIRGLRTEADFAYEMPMAIANKIQDHKISTIFIPTNQESQYVSSTLVREISHHGGDTSPFVPKKINEYLANGN